MRKAGYRRERPRHWPKFNLRETDIMTDMFDVSQRLLNESSEAQLSAVRDKYLRRLLTTNGALDRKLAESTMARLYENAGLKMPRQIIWCELPEDGLIIATLLARMRLPNPLPLSGWHDALDQFMVGRRMREELINPNGDLTDELMQGYGRWLPSLTDTCRIFRDRYGARGVLALTDKSPFPLDTWLDAFDNLEEELEYQSSEIADDWRNLLEDHSEFVQSDPRGEFQHLSAIGNWILQASTSFWNWSHPPMLSGALDSIYAAIMELHQGENAPGLALLEDYMRHCGWCWPFDDVCIMAERPEALFVLKDIEDEANIEVRRLMIDMYGIGNYLKHTRARLMHTDKYGEVYRRTQPNDEDIVVVKVINSTAEPDGSFREYFLRVPPYIQRAREGVAWSFGLIEKDYFPEIET